MKMVITLHKKVHYWKDGGTLCGRKLTPPITSIESADIAPNRGVMCKDCLERMLRAAAEVTKGMET